MTLGIIATLLYLGTSVLLAVRFQHHIKGDTLPRWNFPAIASVWAVAIALHAWILYVHVFTPHGLNMAFFNALSMSAWLIAMLLLLVSLRHPLEMLGTITLPLVSLSLSFSLVFVSSEMEPRATLMEPGIRLHIMLSLLAYSVLGLAAIQALFVAIQNRNLHRHRTGGFIRALPPLAMMESVLFQMIATGFVLLSGGLITGLIFFDNLFAQHLVHKTVLGLTAWVIFAVLLFGRLRFGWRGRIAVRWTLGGFAALMLAYFGSKLVLELILGR